MSVVWKFPLPAHAARIDLPSRARILHAGVDGDDVLCVWALCDPDALVAPRFVRCINTGDEAPLTAQEYIGTVVKASGVVWHVFAEHR